MQKPSLRAKLRENSKAGAQGEETERAHGQLRGCIGTTGPTTENVAWEIVRNAVSACSRDPRFVPVRADELDSLEYSVDVLGEPEAISSPAEQQIDIARQKGGISSRERYTLERFEVVRHI